ncbi:hypothetical protein JTB14_036221 [Gonioctena quinquepunctata]|nr:hypothetical protein JTB14_036221 [Gonioctena quinquepunctata]
MDSAKSSVHIHTKDKQKILFTAKTPEDAEKPDKAAKKGYHEKPLNSKGCENKNVTHLSSINKGISPKKTLFDLVVSKEILAILDDPNTTNLRHISKEISEMQTLQKCNEIINLEKGNVEQTDLACAESNQNLDNHNSHWQTIHRKRTTRMTNLPTQTKTNPPRQNSPKV